jgi:hypothetical protein
MGSNFVKFKTSPIRVAQCEKTRPDDPQTEKQRSEGSCNWLERLSSLCGAIDIRFSMCMKRRSGSQYDEIGNEIGKCHSNISIYFVRWNCPGASCGIFFRGFSFGSLSICSTSSPDCQNSRYGLIVVPETAINAAKYSPSKEVWGSRSPVTFHPSRSEPRILCRRRRTRKTLTISKCSNRSCTGFGFAKTQIRGQTGRNREVRDLRSGD